MKHILLKTNLTLAIFLLSGCATGTTVAPSQNQALNTLSNSSAKKEKSYWMQSHIDGFLEKDWNPVMKKDKTIQKKYGDEKRNFTLQEFVDKQAAYSKAHPSDDSQSNVKKLESMPVIGN